MDDIKNQSPAWELSNTTGSEQSGLIDNQNSVLMVIDFQNFNANKKGFLGHLFDDKNNAIKKTKIVIEKARQAGVPIIYLNTILDPTKMPDTDLFSQLIKMIPWNKLSDEDLQWNFAVIEDLKPEAQDYIVEKGSWSNGFHKTNLQKIIESLKIKRMVFTGVAEPIAIYGTFLGAWDAGLETIMIEDCIMASGADENIQKLIHGFSVSTFYPMMGAKVTSAKYVKFINMN